MYQNILEIKLCMDLSPVTVYIHKLSLWLVVFSRSYRPEEQDDRTLKILLSIE